MDINELRRRAGLNEYYHFDEQSNPKKDFEVHAAEQYKKAIQQVNDAMDIISSYHYYDSLSKNEIAILERAYRIIRMLVGDVEPYQLRGFDRDTY